MSWRRTPAATVELQRHGGGARRNRRHRRPTVPIQRPNDGGCAVTAHPHHPHHPPADWPVDTDVDLNAVRQWIDFRIVGVIAVGGFVGGLARYELVTAW